MAHPIKIATVVPSFSRLGGAENVVYQICSRLAGFDDFQVHVFANRWEPVSCPIFFHKVPIIRFPRWLQPISFAYFAQRAMLKDRYDIIHSHDRIYHMDLFTFHGIPHKTWIHEVRKKRMSLFDHATSSVERAGILNPRLSLIMPVSTLVKEELQKCYDIDDALIRVIHPAISPERFNRPDKGDDRQQIRRQHNIADTDIVVLFVGMNFDVKRLEMVIRGIAAIEPPKRSEIKLLVVGKDKPAPYIQTARNLGIQDQIIFAGVTREVEKYYHAADIFAMPSRYDTFGLVVLEAMVSGLPVIISRKVGAKDFVEPGLNGFVLPKNPSAGDIAAALTTLLDRDRRMTMGKNARSSAIGQTWDRVVNKLAGLYYMISHHAKKI